MYELEYLQIAHRDILEAEEYLGERHMPATDKFAAALADKETLLVKNPLMYKIYEYNPYFRCMPLPYKYLCFYHVDEGAKVVTVHRILHGMRNIPNIL